MFSKNIILYIYIAFAIAYISLMSNIAYSRDISDNDVLIIDFDTFTVDQFGGWPVSRKVHSDIIKKLRDSNAICIFYYIYFYGCSDDIAADKELIETVGNTSKLILPIFRKGSNEANEFFF